LPPWLEFWKGKYRNSYEDSDGKTSDNGEGSLAVVIGGKEFRVLKRAMGWTMTAWSAFFRLEV
jgi:hypothetical protein